MSDFVEYVWDVALGIALGVIGFLTWSEFRENTTEDEEDVLFHD